MKTARVGNDSDTRSTMAEQSSASPLPPARISARMNAAAAHVADTSHGHTEPTPLSRETVQRPSLVWIFLALVFIGGALGGVFALGWFPHEKNRTELIERAEHVKSAAPRVTVMFPKRGAASNDVILPGEIQALTEATLFARTTGYVRKWHADIGDSVKTGQLLAEIDSPEVDRQFESAKAAIAQAEALEVQSRALLEQEKAKQINAQASADLAKLTMTRFIQLRGTNSVSEQEISEKEAAEKIAQAALAASKASVTAAEAAIGVAQSNINAAITEMRRLETMKSFQRVLAPFDGMITARDVDSGSMVMAGGSAGSQSLFHLVNADSVRVFVDIPQTYAPSIVVGQNAELVVREYPASKFVGTVARTARSIRKDARTLRTEIHIPNPKNELLTGMYVQVKLNVAQKTVPLLLPGSALIVNAKGTQVAIARDDTVYFQNVVVDGDYGASFGVSSGITETDAVITNPSERLSQGLHVSVTKAEAKE